MNKRLISWNGALMGVTIGKVYFLHDNYHFVDDAGLERLSVAGQWESIEEESPSDVYDLAGQSMAKFLRAKNKNYGNSVNKPLQVFGPKMSEDSAFFVRMNDKLSRIMNGPDEPRENDIVDLEGYLALYRIRKGWTNLDHMID